MYAAVGMAGARERDAAGFQPSAPRRALLLALVLGVAADAALRLAPDGLGWSLWVVALAAVALHVAARRELDLSREAYAWLGLAVACAAAFAWRDSEQLRAFNILGTLVAVSLFAMSADGHPAASLAQARLRDIITAGVYAARDVAFGAPLLAARDASLHTLPASHNLASWTAVRAVLITLPLVVLVAALLSRADPVFASIFAMPALDVERIVSHVIVIGAFTWWSAGWLWGAVLGVARRNALPDRLPLQLGLVEVTTALGAVGLLLAIFVGLQLRWLFGGAEVVLATTGLTVAEYARRGFFELLAVAVVVLPLLLVTHALAADERVTRRQRPLSYVLVVLLAAIMASALLRLRLYVSYFGLTTDRLHATAIMSWLGVVLIAMALTVLRGRPRPFAAVTVLSAFATLLGLNLINPDLTVARVNLGRPAGVQEVDYAYLARLGGEAVPAVVEALHSAAPSAASCKAVELLRRRWLGNVETKWNVGMRRGRTAVEVGMPDTEQQRLCAGTSPDLVPAPVPGEAPAGASPSGGPAVTPG